MHDTEMLLLQNALMCSYIRSVGANTSKAEHDEIMERMAVFKEWFLSRFVSTEDRDTGNAFVILPIANVAPSYRDEYPGVPSNPIQGLRTTYLSPILGTPELTIPGRSARR